MAIEPTSKFKFNGLDIRPLMMKVLEAKYKLGLGYPQYKAARENLNSELKKTKEGKALLAKIKNIKVYQRLEHMISATRDSHQGLLEAAFPTKLQEVNFANIGREHNISRERVRQIVAVIRMMCKDVSANPTEIVRLPAKKLSKLQEL
jgi:DNA-directed RNA polymerase sigma subunit (sigma70/sigma32)